MKDKIQEYLNKVGWSTVTALVKEFSVSRHVITLALAEMLEDQDVRVYGGEIVHV